MSIKTFASKTGRLHFVANCVYGRHMGGGDTHFFQMAQAAQRAGWQLHFFGGHALRYHLQQQVPAVEQTLTDSDMMAPIRAESLSGQFYLLWDYFKRLIRTMAKIGVIAPGDMAYAVTDYWFDVWPVLLCRAKCKMMILGMDAPTLKQIVRRSRPDVPPIRLNSIYYWTSQNLSLRLFRFCRNKRLLYVHPSMRSRLLRLGYRENEIVYVSNGMDLKVADAIPVQEKRFDVVWIGRYHRQKGIDDLLASLVSLQRQFSEFRAVLIGHLEDELKRQISELGLQQSITFAGLVSDAEKFRLFKASRMMLMPSRYESWGIVIAEALACNVPVVAYELGAYKPVFGNLVAYAPCFDSQKFQQLAAEQLNRCHRGLTTWDAETLADFRENSSWAAAGVRFLGALQSLIHDVS